MVERDLVFAYIGRELERCPNACRLVGYLSFYAYLFVPYYVAIENEPSLLFAPDMELPQFSGNRPCGRCRFPACRSLRGRPFRPARAAGERWRGNARIFAAAAGSASTGPIFWTETRFPRRLE